MSKNPVPGSVRGGLTLAVWVSGPIIAGPVICLPLPKSL